MPTAPDDLFIQILTKSCSPMVEMFDFDLFLFRSLKVAFPQVQLVCEFSSLSSIVSYLETIPSILTGGGFLSRYLLFRLQLPAAGILGILGIYGSFRVVLRAPFVSWLPM